MRNAVTPRELRAVMGAFATGVAVVTTSWEGEHQGMTVNSLTSVSLDPPLVLVCLARGTRTERAVVSRRAFIVNLLAQGQEGLSDRFARRGENHFRDLQPEVDDLGLPRLPGWLAYLVCEVEDIHPGGDHVVVVGRVLRCERRAGLPLIYYQGCYHTLSGQGEPARLDWYW
jgi:3-hydroxy-9,10-secoandrosta-1,3,5(10)-triene-9,17-dione monooxygenase reductase component